MPDLKELLQPLRERQMPDRWDAIRQRPVSPIGDPRPSRVPAYVAAAGVMSLAIAIVAWLSPLGDDGTMPGASTGPPAWLVDQGYDLAYMSGDITPEGAWWSTSDVTAITPSVPEPTSTPPYLIVLEGHFVPDWAKGPSRGSVTRGRWVYATFDPVSHDSLALGVGNDAVDVSSMQQLDLPPASQIFTAAAGWSAVVPPGWHVMPIDQKDVSSDQVVIANADPASLLYAPDPVPNASTIGLPANGVAVVVTEIRGVSSFAPVSAPVSLRTDAERSSGADGSTLQIVVVRGTDALFWIAVRTGRNASAMDLSAMEAAVASIAF